MGQDFITISAKVIDSKSSQPLPYARVIVKKKSFATVSNEAGEFVFHIPRSSGEDTLLTTFVGYEIRSDELAAGYYHYTLYVNNNMVDTKKMALIT